MHRLLHIGFLSFDHFMRIAFGKKLLHCPDLESAFFDPGADQRHEQPCNSAIIIPYKSGKDPAQALQPRYIMVWRLHQVHGYLPVCFIKDDHLMTARRQCDFCLRKHLDLVPHHIDAPAAVAGTVRKEISRPSKLTVSLHQQSVPMLL